MKKFGYIFIFILAGCVFGTALQFSEKDIKGKKNILPNGSFEIGEFNASNIPNGWVLMENEQKANIVWDDKEFIDGTKSLKIYPSKTKVLLISNSFPIFSDDVYFTKCSIKSDIIDNDKFIVRFLTFDKNGNKKESNKIKKRPTKDWKTYHFSSSFFSKNTKFARIIIEIPASTTKTYWIDDVGTFDVYKFK